MFSKFLTATTVALAASLVSAQTHSDCDPTKKGELLSLLARQTAAANGEAWD
jgi:hypothetical protein